MAYSARLLKPEVYGHSWQAWFKITIGLGAALTLALLVWANALS